MLVASFYHRYLSHVEIYFLFLIRLAESLSSSMLSISEEEGQSGNARNQAMFPGRLRIVKPIEGSFTLRVGLPLERFYL